MSMKWIIPNGRGRAMLMLETIEDKREIVAALAQAAHKSPQLATFTALLRDCIGIEEDFRKLRQQNGET